MKRALAAVIALALGTGGCTQVENLQIDLEEKLETIKAETAHAPDHYKTYYSYYIEPAVGRFQGGQTSNVFAYEGKQIILNIDTASLINADYRKKSISAGDLLAGNDLKASASGSYEDHAGDSHSYLIRIFDQGREDFLVLHTDNAYLYARCSRQMDVSMAGEMMKIVRSLSVNEDKVRRDLSTRVNEEQTDYDESRFRMRTPTNGKISDIIESDDDDDEVNQKRDEQAQRRASASPDR
jgi:hypothetical protein